MRPCERCLENNWVYEKKDDGFIFATCQSCWNEVSWKPKPKTILEKIIAEKQDKAVRSKKRKKTLDLGDSGFLSKAKMKMYREVKFPEVKINVVNIRHGISTGTLYFDGSCLTNPNGKTSWAYLLRAGEMEVAGCGTLPHGTNNVGEQLGLLKGLETAIENNIQELVVFGDSKMIIEQAKGNWGCKASHLQDGYNTIHDLKMKFKRIFFIWVPREVNEEADALSKLAYEYYPV